MSEQTRLPLVADDTLPDAPQTATNWKAFGEAITTLVNRYAEGI